MDTLIDGDFCKVVLVNKNPKIPRASPPFTSELYLTIKDDVKTSNLLFSSDSILTDEAMDMWARLLSTGNAISVFDKSIHQFVLTNVKTEQELRNYFGDIGNSKYLFVLSENKEIAYGVKHSIDLMEIKRRDVYPLFEQFKRSRLV